jgi:hypothetical protein
MCRRRRSILLRLGGGGEPRSQLVNGEKASLVLYKSFNTLWMHVTRSRQPSDSCKIRPTSLFPIFSMTFLFHLFQTEELLLCCGLWQQHAGSDHSACLPHPCTQQVTSTLANSQQDFPAFRGCRILLSFFNFVITAVQHSILDSFANLSLGSVIPSVAEKLAGHASFTPY